uniref:Uncharacterized protein n=1 Tax=Callorhinchus milii TaxID=7868 RepID=A0A4W3JDU2_CALMI
WNTKGAILRGIKGLRTSPAASPSPPSPPPALSSSSIFSVNKIMYQLPSGSSENTQSIHFTARNSRQFIIFYCYYCYKSLEKMVKKLMCNDLRDIFFKSETFQFFTDNLKKPLMAFEYIRI